MEKKILHARVLDEDEIKELIVEGLKRRGYVVKLVTLDGKAKYDDGDLVGIRMSAEVQIEMPEVFRPVQEQWNGEK